MGIIVIIGLLQVSIKPETHHTIFLQVKHTRIERKMY